MSKLLCIFSLTILILSSCTLSQQLVSNLELKNNKYYGTESGQLFSGKAITKFDNGIISSSTELKNGIPNGKWFAYGYKNEVIQEGKYIPIFSAQLGNEKKIERLNVCFGKEGNYLFIDVYAIADKNLISDTINLKRTIEQFLQKENIISNKDSINELKVVIGELE
ncbi:hypothetical protein GA0116948_1315 [Chitinophaga costaii]|uniref:Lipoprotein n=1 Tax=Chitinophaga costaii TaxID=1335309 RepID=A0A1C4G9J2_9BACT|nr:hypothetical protein [Chitinophaga costaii]PUZ19213.1 hypothetical protein DCM91_20815 [Chitinophaga costaii]SCC64411.1 hypothetical protein GA0116948_1315 [Chitinophaga costaii]